MCPKEARIFLAEDDKNWRYFHSEALSSTDHQIVIETTSRKESLEAIEKAKTLGVNVALLDGSLPSNREDGNIIASALREAIPKIKIVDVSTFGDAIKGADAIMSKRNYKLNGIGQLITDL